MGRSRVRRRNASTWLAPVPALPAVVLKKTAQPRQTESQRPQSTASTIAQQDKVLTYSFDDDYLNSAEQEFFPDDAQLTLERLPVLFSVEEADVIMGEFCARLAMPVTTPLVVPEEVVDLSDDGSGETVAKSEPPSVSRPLADISFESGPSPALVVAPCRSQPPAPGPPPGDPVPRALRRRRDRLLRRVFQLSRSGPTGDTPERKQAKLKELLLIGASANGPFGDIESFGRALQLFDKNNCAERQEVRSDFAYFNDR